MVHNYNSLELNITVLEILLSALSKRTRLSAKQHNQYSEIPKRGNGKPHILEGLAAHGTLVFRLVTSSGSRLR